MKKVCICSSFKFYEKVQELAEKLKEAGIECFIPLPSKKFRNQDKPDEFVADFDNMSEQEKLQEAKRMALEHFDRMNRADCIFILSPTGYVGKSVCMEIGYAHAKKIPVYASSKLEDFFIMSMVDKIVSEQEFIEILRQ